MRRAIILVSVTILAASSVLVGQSRKPRLNPVIRLLEEGKPVFGVYTPSAFPPGGRRGAPPPPDTPQKPPIELAGEALAYKAADYLFNGSMEGGVDRALPAVTDFVKAMGEAAGEARGPFFGLVHPLIVKTPKIAPDTTKAVENISRELNIGAAG